MSAAGCLLIPSPPTLPRRVGLGGECRDGQAESCCAPHLLRLPGNFLRAAVCPGRAELRTPGGDPLRDGGAQTRVFAIRIS